MAVANPTRVSLKGAIEQACAQAVPWWPGNELDFAKGIVAPVETGLFDLGQLLQRLVAEHVKQRREQAVKAALIQVADQRLQRQVLRAGKVEKLVGIDQQSPAIHAIGLKKILLEIVLVPLVGQF